MKALVLLATISIGQDDKPVEVTNPCTSCHQDVRHAPGVKLPVPQPSPSSTEEPSETDSRKDK